MTALTGLLPAAAPGFALGIVAMILAARASRRQRTALEHLREELLVMMSQHRTEYRDSLDEMGRAIAFQEESARQTEEALRERLTPSLRSRAIQLLRSGLSADSAASTLGMPRSDLRLIAAVFRIFSPR